MYVRELEFQVSVRSGVALLLYSKLQKACLIQHSFDCSYWNFYVSLIVRFSNMSVVDMGENRAKIHAVIAIMLPIRYTLYLGLLIQINLKSVIVLININ